MSNEDKSLSLARERKAWIGYDFANSCYATVAIATFLPLVLNAYAESEAWRGKLKPKMCSTLDVEYSEKCLECRVGEGNLLCSGEAFWSFVVALNRVVSFRTRRNASAARVCMLF